METMRAIRRYCSPWAAVAAACALTALGACEDDTPAPIPSTPLKIDLPPLAQIAVPLPAGGDVIDHAAAVRLGKALFWDMQAGGDGQTACATCHFAAGADTRLHNVIHPGANGAFEAVSGPGQDWTPTSMGGQIDDVCGSPGVTSRVFVGVDPDPAHAADLCNPGPATPFGGERQVTGRNSPSAVGAVFYRQGFWDGRASDVFNGLDPFGTTGNATAKLVEVKNAQLASQAVGPPGSEVEMTCAGRPMNGATNSMGAKLLSRPPLALQLVDATDSVLGALSAAPEKGLHCGGGSCSYREMIRAAFGAALAADAEAQFSRIFGQAVAAYEATLIPNDTPFDRFLAGDHKALTSSQKDGARAFFSKKTGCANCHAGSELSDATVGYALANGIVSPEGGDQGFHNVGVRPTAEDLGRAGVGPMGVPWSESGSAVDRGGFKCPQLRNVKLTPPYMHTGGEATLADVVEFYDRGGDFANAELSPDIKPLGLSAADKAALVDFLANALTDCRTEKDRAPFDHPSLELPGRAPLPATGAAGTGSCP